MNGKGEMRFTLEDVSFENLERYRRIFHAIIASGYLNIESGQVTLHFQNGEVRQVDLKTSKKVRHGDKDDDKRGDVLEP